MTLETPYSGFTSSALEDEITRILSSKPNRVYLAQAELLIHRINIYDPLPEFKISLEDLPAELVQELESLQKITMKRIITNVVRRLYESVDPDYFHTNGIYGRVKWRTLRQKK